jgi:hypothetical protein
MSEGPVERPPGRLGRLFRKRPGPTGRHIARVLHVDPPDGSYQPYWVAMCDLEDLFPDAYDSERAAFEAAREHCESVDPTVHRPLDPGYVAPPRGEEQWRTT